MRKMLNLSLLYFILAMVCGVFYREFTKINGYEGRTALAFAHVHFMVLGMALFLILALFAKSGGLTEQRSFRIFLVLYNIGLPLMVVMLIIRGIIQVLGIVPAKGAECLHFRYCRDFPYCAGRCAGIFVRSFKRRITGMGKTTDG